MTVVIRKYPNRRLYDSTAGRYVNLEDIAARIRDGQDVQVVEAKTGEDVTHVILTQIIVEDARGQPAGLPLEVLREMIVATDRARKDLVAWSLESASEAYKSVQDRVQSRIEALSPLALVKKVLGTQGSESEVEQLRRKVADLEARLAVCEADRGRGPAAQEAPKRPRARRSKTTATG